MSHYDELLEVIRNLTQDIRIRYTELYRILCLVLEEATEHTGIDFSGPFARLTFACQNNLIDRDLQYQVNTLRNRCHSLHEHSAEELVVLLPHDVRVVARMVSELSHQPIPESLANVIPVSDKKTKQRKVKAESERMRVSVMSWDSRYITAMPDQGFAEPVTIDCFGSKGLMGTWEHLLPLIQVGTQLGLLKCVVEDTVYYPEVIIFEPDYLVDVSKVASCFKVYGSTPFSHLVNRLGEKQSSSAILLGNFAGQLLDEEINRRLWQENGDYVSSARRFMQENILPILVNKEKLSGFHQAAQAQQMNLRKILQQAIMHDKAMDIEHVLLEASVMCEALGLQGRMDLITDDCRVLMEQKSGKRDEFRHNHVESHYVQILLYQAMLHYGFGLRNNEISCYLIYSKYEDGLLKEGSAPQLLKQALQIRNQMAWLDFHLGSGEIRMLKQLRPEHLRGADCGDNLWKRGPKDELTDLLGNIQNASDVAKAYYFRMMSFVAQEHLLAKIGAPGRDADGMASLWRSPLEEKMLAGNILMGLKVGETEKNGEGGVEVISFALPISSDTGIPNFRVGDSVVCYAYPEHEVPDVRKGLVFRSAVLEFSSEKVKLQLKTAQRNPHVFTAAEGKRWAIEHDCIETGFSNLYRSVYSLLITDESRRQLLLSQRNPEQETTVMLKGDYSMDGDCPHFNQLVLQARQAKDYFILIGPPGTGKTSFGMVNILRETLAHPEETVLLLSYTNRAVDEICSKLVSHGIDFIRIGRTSTCAEAYRPYLLGERTKEYSRMEEIENLLWNNRVFVGTTSSMTSHSELLQMRTFDMAIIDEASQILEPQILGILCAMCKGKPSIKKFVMIGDHKQLPAVVQQPAEKSAVEEEILQQIGLQDCRESLFQRLIRSQQMVYGDNSPYIYRFDRQGRMHPDVARFAVDHFYEGRLGAVPLPHQLKELDFPVVDLDNMLELELARNRTLFFPSQLPEDSLSPKTNPVEARMIAQVVYTVYQLYAKNHRQFSPQETVGVIVPYRLQIAQVMNEISQLRIPELNEITVDTVERYQGSQREVIVYGFTVRHPYQLKFLCSQSFIENGVMIDRKLNVALTRAKEQMILIGNPAILQHEKLYSELIQALGETKFTDAFRTVQNKTT